MRNLVRAVLVAVVFLLSGCATTDGGDMEPIEQDGDRLRYQYFTGGFVKAQAGAEKRCAARGRSAKLGKSYCQDVDVMDNPSGCLAVAVCEYCQTWFECVE